ncbi:hypothetical protein BX265_7015 [Streptomyces sp. TLI_235]|nr:hypothetical protein [Streptomyces sp. TLI_235]PBC69677.1 hypothetical protein BX265_7015 [Streptomyces sp. TLI_235]
MYELSRVRVCSAGPAGARFQDVILDFSGAGDQVTAVQGNLFGTVPQLLRPSPASVVFLENGGGKSVLLKLLFSVILPGRRQVKDAPNPRLLEDYVLARDVSHIALEWMHATTGRLLVTAKVLHWKDQVVSTVAENLVEEWYAFRPTDTLGLDSLPTVEEGKYLSLSAYRGLMKEIGAQDQRLEMHWPVSQDAWTELLDQLGLDPELFRYQRTMNKDEGEAVHAFTLDSDGRFVDFLLKAVFHHKSLDDLANLVSTYAHKLAGRKDLLLELDFVEQTMTLLEPLIEAARAVNGSRVRAQQAQQDLASFGGQVQERVRGDLDRLARLEKREQELTAGLTRATYLTRRWAATVARQRLVLAQLRLDQAKAEAGEATLDKQQAQATVAGWKATGAVQRHLSKSEAARALALLVNEGERAASPALKARERCAEALAQGLLALRDRARSAQTEQGGEALKQTEAEKETRKAREAALREANRADTEVRALLERVGAARNEAEQAVAAGLAPAADLVPKAAAEARTAVTLAVEKISALESEQESVDRRQADVQQSLSAAIREEEAARNRREEAQRILQVSVSRTSAIEAEPRLTALLGATVRLDMDAQVLLERLDTAIADTQRDSVALQIERARDELAHLALKDGRMLPPPQVVRDACRLLEQSDPRIDAWPGWEYIAEFPLQQREKMITCAPHLVSGVLLNSPDDQRRAQEILGQAAPTAYCITVGTVEGLYTAEGGTAEGTLFTLPFNAALYEEKAAEAEQKAIEERWTRSGDRLKELQSTRQHDDALRQRISLWREEYPVGALAGLEEACAAAGEALAEAEEVAAAQGLAMEGLLERREEIRGELRDAREGHERWQEADRRLTELGKRLDQIPSWLENAKNADEQRRVHQERADKAEKTAEEHRRLAESHRDTSEEQRRTALAASQEWAALPGAQDMQLEAEPPGDPIPVLRDAYEKAKANFDSANVPGELRERLVRAEEAAREAATEYSALSETDRSTAHRLLSMPEAMDERSRAEAQQQADRALASAECTAEHALLEQGKHDNALVERREAFLLLTADGIDPMLAIEAPHTIDGCLETVASAESEHAAAQEAQAAALAQRTVAAADTTRAKNAAKAFERLVQALANTPTEQNAAPYTGDGDSAWSDYLRLDGAAKDAKEALARDEKGLRSASDQLTRHAAAGRYARLTIPVRQQILDLSIEHSAQYAASWHAALQPRKRNLADEIDEVNQHRQTIIDHLKGESDKALSLLRSAQRLSRLPRSLGDWAGQEFIHFSFQQQPDELLLPRLGDLAEEAASGQTTDGRKVARDGLSLLLRAVHTAVPTGFRVQILKPDTVLRTERVPVSKVKDVFSGGQQLTAAILLYCTMAALRANQQGRERSRHSGVLFLDNPIGRANADYLLDLQRQVAQALGVQLVYTTGLYDEKALGKFPLIVRLRNDADLRAARKYLVVNDVIRQRLDALAPEDGTGQIDSARILRREESRVASEGNDDTAAPGE